MAVANRPPTDGAWPSGAMPIEATDVTGARAVLALRGDIDASLSWELDVWLEVAMEGRRRVVLDVEGLRRIDGPALEVILDARERFRDVGGELLISGAWDVSSGRPSNPTQPPTAAPETEHEESR